MKKVLILGVIAVLVAVFAYFSLFGGSEKKSDSQREVDAGLSASEQSAEAVVVEPKSGFGTLEELRLLNEDLECTITYESDEQADTIEGTYFVSEGSMRGDFLTESPDMTGQVLTSMIIAGSDVYVWSEIEGEKYGIKMDTSIMEDETVETNEPVSLDTDIKYNCKVWKEVDETVFIPPGDVLFQNMAELMRAGMEEGIIYEEGEELPF